MEVVQLDHRHIGSIRGKKGDGVTQYLAIKYASIKDRLAPPQMVEEYHPPVQATEVGPAVLSTPSGCDDEYGFIQCALPKDPTPQSELDGLHLNITVPTGKSSSPSGLPVFVFIYGGGFRVGSNAWPQYDYSKLVKLSEESGYPMIAVGINYRLGLPGLITSEELRKAGYPGNNSIRDQRVALYWIRQNIAGFGGDPENITLGGESAGGASASFHLHSKEPLFKRLVMMSGSSLLIPPLPSFICEHTYASAIDALGLKDLSADERIKALLTMPHDKILEKLPPSVSFMPLLDDDLLPVSLKFEQMFNATPDELLKAIPGLGWCESLMVGDVQFDASIFARLFEQRKTSIGKSFQTSFQKSIPDNPDKVNSLLKAYHITESTDDHEAFVSILELANDICFHCPTMAFAHAWPVKPTSNCHVYFFNEPNPWDGPWKGRSTHILDITFMFQNFNHLLPDEKQREIAKQFGRDLVKFVSGESPWPRFDKGKPGGVRVYGHDDATGTEEGPARFMEDMSEKGTGRRVAMYELGKEIGLDHVSRAWTQFMIGQ